MRLIFGDGRYVNIFVPYHGFKYEKLFDVPLFVEAGSVVAVRDVKSGYHALATHALSTYLGFEFEGVTYVCTVLLCGYAPTCRQFPELMEFMLQPLRQLGKRMSFYIDDKLQDLAQAGEADARHA
eukprot:jgi/Tetstr1/440632/TSEL_028942.t1